MEVIKKKLEDVITFGKYKGKSIHQVLHIDASYLVWAHNTIEWFKLEDGILTEAIDKASSEHREYLIQNYDPIDYADIYGYGEYD